MNPHWPLVHVLRLCLQSETAVSVGAGAGDGSDDLRLALAPNGLPTLPATGLRGVMRARVRALRPDLVDSLFGWARGQSGAASRLQVEPGVLHGADDRPARGWAPLSSADPLLAAWQLQAPPLRRRNAGGHRGATLRGAHFDRPYVQAGSRFTTELRVWGHDEAALATEAELLVSLFQGEGLRLGGGTRSGIGRIAALSGNGVRHQRFDLRKPEQLAAYCQWMADGDTRQLQQRPALQFNGSSSGHGRCTITGVTDGPFRVGGGTHSLSTTPGDPPDDVPYVEQRVVWMPQGAGERGRLEWCVVIPFSAIKGALSHRVAFHDHRLRGTWATAERAAMADVRRLSPAVTAWFGLAAGRHGGQAGAVSGDDVLVSAELACRHLGRAHRHMSDRFTASPMPKALFDAESLYDLPLKLHVDVDFAHARRNGADSVALQALDLALADLAQGRLAIGADDAVGLGALRPGSRIDCHAWGLTSDSTDQTREAAA